MARPPMPIDEELVFKMAQWGCKTEEIADHFGCSTDTIQRRCAAELIKGRADLRMSLRQWQLASAKKGNVAMLIWLGKQMLGQQDRYQLEVSQIDDATFVMEAERRLIHATTPVTDASETDPSEQQD